MSLDSLYDKVRKPLPQSLKLKIKLFEEFRVSKYSGKIDSEDYEIKKEYLEDIVYAIQSQISKRMLIFTLISAVAGVVSIISLLFNLLR